MKTSADRQPNIKEILLTFYPAKCRKEQGRIAYERKKKLARLWSFLLVLVMLAGMLPTIALAEESDAFWQYANAPGEYIYNVSGNFNSEGPTVDTTFTLTQPTKIKGGKKYYIRVRTYKTIKVNGKTVKLYSSWSSSKAVTTRK